VYFVALATDYDGTLALDGKVDAATIAALKDLKSSGRRLILVTGRDLPDLQRACPELELFDLVVAENGALLFNPAKKEETALAEPPSQELVARLRARGVSPLSVGRSIVATWEPHETAVLETIHELGLELHIVFNKGAVMVLPGNVNKASGLQRALKPLCLSAHNVVAIGDAENDQAFLSACGCAVAVENALASVKAKADMVVADHGKGVIELAQRLIDDDLRSAAATIPRVLPELGRRPDNSRVGLSPFDVTLITGVSGGGKSSIVTALLEQIRDLGFQFCVVDPEGDYAEFPDAVVVGDPKQEPRIAEIARLLAKPDVSLIINLLAFEPPERPRFVAKLLPEIAKLRAESGRPHWIVIDEAHHCLPANWEPGPITLPRELPAAIAVTVHPGQIAREFLGLVSVVLGVGDNSLPAVETFCQAVGWKPQSSPPRLARQQVYLLRRDGHFEIVTAITAKEKQRRHARKYAEGELGEDKSFYFRGPEAALNLRAHNLATFLQMAAGVDDKTWQYHLQAQEYSRWFREGIKDEDLAAEAEMVEAEATLGPKESRQRIREMIERRYTAPAKT
jgi:hydroxymethylpyrimidine pyrophosphatase-like HAD family hydrolase